MELLGLCFLAVEFSTLRHTHVVEAESQDTYLVTRLILSRSFAI